MRLRFRWTSLFAILLLASACAPAASGPAPRDRSIISEEELTALPSGMNAFEAVQRLRPFWLNVRANRSFNAAGAEMLVYQGEMRLGSVDNLRNIRVTEVRRLEFFDPAQAVARLPGIGNSRPAGAIVVRMRAG